MWPQTHNSPDPAFWVLLSACFGFHFVRTVFDRNPSKGSVEASGQPAPEVLETRGRTEAGRTLCSSLPQVIASSSGKLLILDDYSVSGNRNVLLPKPGPRSHCAGLL